MFGTSVQKQHLHTHARNRLAVIPTAERLGADARYSGRGIRVAFLDSGFIAHPDFASRVIEFHDIAGEDRSLGSIQMPAAHHWHGTQTVASCAGDGLLSDGIYRGIAWEAELVLVKVSRNGRIGDSEIEAGLQWVVDNRERLAIRVLNVSLGGDCDLPTPSSRINLLVERLVSDGVVVTVAAGNSPEMRSAPPASAPSAITVGGFSDGNRKGSEYRDLYHSSYGITADGTIKPELIAPAMFIAAPILPGTNDYLTAEALSMLSAAPDYAFGPLLEEAWSSAGLVSEVLDIDIESARGLIEDELRRRKIIATHYQHVDGTSFAAPITASVVAQMLEANPGLTPLAVKNILISSATSLEGHARVRQGFGVIEPGAAVERAAQEVHLLREDAFHPPRVVGGEVVFRFHHDTAQSIQLVGDVNEWTPGVHPFEQCGDGLWRVVITRPSAGRYRYKFLVDEVVWTEDPSHGLKEDDGLGGFNSVLVVQ